jgi:hypothetical protein|tara:strand:+ start:275 stop:460 length:186 start_codon:yes stop_codon:yes gene_type:complete
MFEKIKNIFKKKPKVEKEKRTYEKAIDHSNDITFENEIKKPEVKAKAKETKETKSSLTLGV